MRGCTLAVASALVQAGGQVGDHVLLRGPNGLAWLYCDFGIQAAGAVSVPIYSGTVPDVAQGIAANCDAVLANASDSKMAATMTTTENLRRIVTMYVAVAEWLPRTPKPRPDV